MNKQQNDRSANHQAQNMKVSSFMDLRPDPLLSPAKFAQILNSGKSASGIIPSSSEYDGYVRTHRRYLEHFMEQRAYFLELYRCKIEAVHPKQEPPERIFVPESTTYGPVPEGGMGPITVPAHHKEIPVPVKPDYVLITPIDRTPSPELAASRKKARSARRRSSAKVNKARREAEEAAALQASLKAKSNLLKAETGWTLVQHKVRKNLSRIPARDRPIWREAPKKSTERAPDSPALRKLSPRRDFSWASDADE